VEREKRIRLYFCLNSLNKGFKAKIIV
jgi:hypothetical protein